MSQNWRPMRTHKRKLITDVFIFYIHLMKKIWLFFTLFASLLLFWCSQPIAPTTTTEKATVAIHQDDTQYQSKIAADKIQLYHFRGTNQCWTCITLGELTEKTLHEYFADELKSGKITYEDINAELPENQALAQKFGVKNISLYINTIIDGNESYEEQVSLMRYLNNEEQFKSMLKEKLDWLLWR